MNQALGFFKKNKLISAVLLVLFLFFGYNLLKPAYVGLYYNVKRDAFFQDIKVDGIMQSLTTDIITQDYDTITGLQRNIEKFFNRLTHDKIGNENAIHKAVVAFSTAGLNIEDL